MSHYIMVMRDTKCWLVGPFEDQSQAARFGRMHYAPGGIDDPRWQTIELANNSGFMRDENNGPANHFMVPVHSPTTASKDALAVD